MKDKNTYTIIVESDNTPGVLYRISGIFLRKKINVEKLTVYEIKEGLSQFTIVINASFKDIERVVNLIRKIFEVNKAEIIQK